MRISYERDPRGWVFPSTRRSADKAGGNRVRVAPGQCGEAGVLLLALTVAHCDPRTGVPRS